MAGSDPTLPRISLILAATVTLLRVGATPPRALADREVTVTDGDTLTAIALTYLGDAGAAAMIAAYNNLSEPDRLVPGQVLKLPDVPVSLAVGSSASAGTNDRQSASFVSPPPQTGAPRAGPIIQSGFATWYGPGFDGQLTKCGHVFHETDLTASSNDLPCGSIITVTNLRNGRSVVVTVDDTGGFQHPTILDLSRAAFSSIESPDTGIIEVSVASMGAQTSGVSKPPFLARPE